MLCSGSWPIGIVVALVLGLPLLVLAIALLVTGYKKCPSDKVMVILGRVGKDRNGNARSSICVYGGAVFVWPFVQSYRFLDLTPIPIEIELEDAVTGGGERLDISVRFTVGISTEPGVMQRAAECLLGLEPQQIGQIARDILIGQLRLSVASTDTQKIYHDADRFLESLASSAETELKKLGMRLINLAVIDLDDEDGYIAAARNEAAAKAIEEAKKKVAERAGV